ncbi:MFS transporter [Aliidiomarina sedimenti]|uniref:MFS transporter n=1 Tax=Aliidiomarina sedimenti TaxID=1933879 RepID=A0ABY0BZN1_9GAMM|nr:MFS transporter [Aliidiomarina sedimenti]RUO30628.1 MFS transporter [Aliidiomarina sedimenti]
MNKHGLNSVEKKAAVSLASVFGLRMLGLFLIMPVIAVYGQDYADYSPMLIGVAIGAYGLTQAMLQIPMGWVSDRIGRRPVIVGGLLVFAAGSVVAAMADSLVWVIVGRALQGAGAIASAILALASDCSRDEQRPKVMATIGLCIGLAFALALVLGPWLGGIVGMSGLFWFTALSALLAVVLVLTITPQPVNRTPKRDLVAVPTELMRLIKHPQLLQLNFGIFILHLVLTAWFVSLPLTLVDAGLAAEQHGWLYLPTLLLSFLVMVPMMIIAMRRKRQLVAFRVAIAMLVLAMCAIAAFAQSLTILFLAVWIFFIGFNYLEANLPALLAQFAPAGSKGSASGVYTSCQFLGAFIGGVAGGMLFGKFGMTGVVLFCILLLIIWLLVSAGMKLHTGVANVSYAAAPAERQMAVKLAEQLAELPGVLEAVVLADEQTTYLKVQRDQFDDQAARRLLQLH